jgi:hypothetical protein
LQKLLSTETGNKSRFRQKMLKTISAYSFTENAPRRGVVLCEPLARDQRTLVKPSAQADACASI